ncbi:MAG TPA: hypothetical protein VI855_01990 [Dehalococcoidia bacterium]|nr:hypothetical protein [Dehalococcoidia bacterium]
MTNLLMETLKFCKGIDPVADAFDNAVIPASDVYNMEGYEKILFMIYIGVGATGTQTWTVEACDDVVPTNVTAIPFWHREILTTDVEGTLTRDAAAGFTVTAGSSKIILVEAHADELPSNRAYIRLVQSAEPVNSPCLGGVMAMLGGARYASLTKPTVLT